MANLEMSQQRKENAVFMTSLMPTVLSFPSVA